MQVKQHPQTALLFMALHPHAIDIRIRMAQSALDGVKQATYCAKFWWHAKSYAGVFEVAAMAE